MDWKNISKSISNETGQVARKRLPRKIRQIPDWYFLPQRSLPPAIAYCGVWISGGIGAGMLLKVRINKMIKVDGGIIWDFDK